MKPSSDRNWLARTSVVLLTSFVAIACAAEGATTDEIDSLEGDAGGASASTTKDAGKDSGKDATSDAATDATDAHASDSSTSDAKADTSPIDSGSDAQDSGKDAVADAKVDSGAVGADCPVDPLYIAAGFAELMGSSPTMCLNKPCPASKCCVQVYGVCVPK